MNFPRRTLYKLNWYTHLVSFLRGNRSQSNPASHRLPLPRSPIFGDELGQELDRLTNIFSDENGLIDSTRNHDFVHRLAGTTEINELLHYFESNGKIELLKEHMRSQPFCPKPVKAGELFQDGQTRNAATRYHVEQNWFRNAWCHSRFEPGNLPLLADYPWFEELWG